MKKTLIPILACAFIAARPAAAQSTWTGLGATNNWSDAANWNAPLTTSTTLTFNGTTQTVTNNDQIAFGTGNLVFNNKNATSTGNFTIGGNDLAQIGTSILTTASNATNTQLHTISANLSIVSSGTSLNVGAFNDLAITGLVSNNSTARNLIKNGAGTLTLSNNANSFGSSTSGVFNIQNGPVGATSIADLGGNCALGVSNLQIGNGNSTGTINFDLSSANTSNRTFLLGSNTTNASGGGTLNNISANASHTLTLTAPVFNPAQIAPNSARLLTLGGNNTGANTVQGVIQDNNTANGSITNLTKASTGTWILSGNNTYSGNTTINSGVLRIGAGGTSGTLGSGNVSASNAFLAFNRADAVTVSNNITCTAATTLNQVGPGNTTLTGALTLPGSTLRFGAADSIASPAGTLKLAQFTTISSNPSVSAAEAGDGGTLELAGGFNLGSANATFFLKEAFSGTLRISNGTYSGAGRTAIRYDAPSSTGATVAIATGDSGTPLEMNQLANPQNGAALNIRAEGQARTVKTSGGCFILFDGTCNLLAFTGDQDLTLIPSNNLIVNQNNANRTNFEISQQSSGVTNLSLGNATAGTLSLSGANSTLGAVKISGNGTGTLILGSINTGTQIATLEIARGANTLTEIVSTGSLNGGATLTSGTLLLNNPSGSALGAGNVTVNGGKLGGTGGVSGNVTVNGGGLSFALSTAPGSHDSLAVGNLTFAGNSTLTISASGNSTTTGNYTLVTANSPVTGTPPTLSLPSGWAATTLYSGNDLVLNVTSIGASPYDTWAGGNFTNPFSNTGKEVDFDNDGLKNLLEFVLNGDPTVSDNPSPAPALTVTGTDFVFSFNRRDDSVAETTVLFQYGNDLATWSNATVTPGNSTFTINATLNGTITVNSNNATTDAVSITIPKAASSTGKLFGRLNATQP
jgi:fibronectin-binding autotransporter adhesin